MKNIITGFTIIILVFTGMIMPAYAEKEVKLTYAEGASDIASIHVVKAVLQEKMGYNVKIIPLNVSAMWQTVASGDADGLVSAWLPGTHGNFLDEVSESVNSLGPNLRGTRIGLVVPAYVEINSIEELNEAADKFDDMIVGIDLGSGLMARTEEALEDYKLEQFELMESSEEIMTTILQKKIEKQVWVVVTGWTPHWMFAEWDLKYLDDPEEVYGGEEYIGTIVRKDLKEDMPEVYRFLDNFEWMPEDMEEVMAWNAEGTDPYESAKRWIQENPAKVVAWLK